MSVTPPNAELVATDHLLRHLLDDDAPLGDLHIDEHVEWLVGRFVDTVVTGCENLRELENG